MCMNSFCHTSCIIRSYESNVWLILHSAGLDVDSCLCLHRARSSITRNQVISLVTASTEFIELSSQTLQSSLVSLQRFNLLWLWDCEAGCNISLFWNITWLTIRGNIWPKIRKKERITEGPSRSDHFQSTVISLECTFHLVFLEFYTVLFLNIPPCSSLFQKLVSGSMYFYQLLGHLGQFTAPQFADFIARPG